MDRRNFLRNTASFVTLPLLINGQALQVFGSGNYFNPDSTNGKILVLIQLDGGNDGLNMLVPRDKYDALTKLRPGIVLPESKVISLTDKQGLHPAMTGIKSLYDEQKIMFVQNVGYPQPNLSHFRSKEIINSASDSKTVVSSGWLGRWLEKLYPQYPNQFPNTANPHPLAITVGSTSLPTCQGGLNNMAMVLESLQTNYDAGTDLSTFPDTPYGHELAYIAEIMQSTEKYLEVISQTAALSQTKSNMWPAAGTNSLADKLQITARLINGGLNTPVYMISFGGFDTHSAQVTEGQTEAGAHAGLLQKISKAIQAFTDELKISKKEDQVIGMVFSEFGRRIASNSSFGTDHGEAFPIMLFGNQINPVIFGENPDLQPTMDKKENVRMKIDFRSVYASILYHWFKLEKTEINTLLFGTFETIPILKSAVANENELVLSENTSIRSVIPNPIGNKAEIHFFSKGGKVQIQLVGIDGKISRKIFSESVQPGSHYCVFNRSNLPAGLYFLTIIEKAGKSTYPVTLN